MNGVIGMIGLLLDTSSPKNSANMVGRCAAQG